MTLASFATPPKAGRLNTLWSWSVRTAAALALVALVWGLGILPGRAQGRDQNAVDLNAALDPSCPACRDFYQFATGGWRRRNPVPPAYSSWSHDNVIAERTRTLLRGILEEAEKHPDDGDPDTRRLGLFYKSCIDSAGIAAAGTRPLQDELVAIDGITDRAGVVASAARINAQGGNALLQFSSAQDLRDSTRVVGELDQGGLGLPDRDYYLRGDPKSQALLRTYRRHVALQFRNSGDEPEEAAREAAAVVALETRLAKEQLSNVQVRDPKTLDHPTTMAALQQLAPRIDWEGYFRDVDAPPMSRLNVGMPGYIRSLSRELPRTPLSDWKTYLRWQLVAANASALPARFERAAFEFYGGALRGRKQQLPRWKRCVAATDMALGDALGRAYVKLAFPPESKARALALTDNLQATLRGDLATKAWMSQPTRTRAVHKLDLLLKKIGYPNHWRDYSAMHIEDAPYAANAAESRRFEVARQLAKIGRPVDREEWQMTAATVNAYYNPQLNEIVFPAAVLQPPYFNLTDDDAVNYGEAGAIIGHEMTHGFDDEGRQFDGEGNLRNWWTPADGQAWDRRTKCIADQASRYVAIDNLHLNGRLVVGEATADLGGLVIAYRAFERAQAGKPRRTLGGFTPEQRFFIAYANSWATSYTPQTVRYLVQADPHPVAAYRVNGTLADMAEFTAAFHCTVRDPMTPSQRCSVW